MAERTTDVTCVARLFRLMALRTTNVTYVARFFRVMALRMTYISSVAPLSRLMDERDFRELTSGEFDRLVPGRTVSIGSDRVCLPISSIPLAHVNLLLPVPPVKRHTAISGSGRNRTQSGCW